MARARLGRLQADTRIAILELLIATEVRDAARQVNMNAKRVDATTSASRFAERRLESEEKRFHAGLSTSFLVFQAQRNVAQARNAGLSAILDYNTSLVDFEPGKFACPAVGAIGAEAGAFVASLVK